MIRHLLLCSLLLLFFSGNAQLTENHKNVLAQEILSKLNKHRDSKNLQELKTDPILTLAADNQSIYIANLQELTHEQANTNLKTPFDRVIHFGGNDFEIVGENVLYTANIELPFTSKSLSLAAEEMYTGWKNSPPHYKNMIHPKYEFSGLAFYFSASEKKIYATQVFAKKGIRIPNQISDKAFGLINRNTNCEAKYKIYSNIITNMGNAIRIENDEVVYRYHDKDYFKKIFTESGDGMAVDIIEKNQLQCNTENQLDLSRIYDGVLLKPIYRDEILNNNQAKSDYRIISKIATIPSHLTEKEISLSVIFIGNNQSCKYIIPTSVPSKSYKLRDIKPKLNKPEGIKFIYEGIINSIHLNFNFLRGVDSPEQYPELPNINQNMHSIEIVSYSSVEGDLKSNIKLHDNRAEKIKAYLKQSLTLRDDQVKIISGENWDKMNFQLKYNFADHLLELSQDELKELIANGDETLAWDSLLYKQRQSTATLNYYGKVEDKKQFVEVAKLNLRTAIATKNHDLANKTLYKMFESKSKWPELIFEDQIFNAIMSEPKLVQNAAAFMTKTYGRHHEKSIQFLDKWISNHEKLSEEAKYNLYILYALINYKLLDNWDVPSKSLSHVIHPVRIQASIYSPPSNQLMLNLHLTFINYYGQINDGQKISESFNYISNYFKSKVLSPQDEIDLVMFYNNWSMYHLTTEYLYPKFSKNKLNEESLFILMETINYSEEFPDIFDQVYLKAYETNKRRWCNYIDDNFQILRLDKVKNIYCSQCGPDSHGDL